MAQPEALLDTDTLSAIMRGQPLVSMRTRDYLAEHRSLTLSIITRYEILRGLKAKNATTQIQTFDRLCTTCRILPVTEEVVVTAAEIYAALKQRGEPIGDADILIGASALAHGLAVVTNNEDHFRRIPGLHVENWLRP
jgi:tRNA(fMet)-specific endonuclease VapC